VTVKVWNPTLANLTLMALGSSAPEILLSVIETVQTLDSTPGELGPSTIVGSAAFNLMVISAVSVYSVNESNSPNIIESTGLPDPDQPPAGLKKINDLGVFAVTAVASVFAYVWLYLCLKVMTPNEVTMVEAWLTLGFFFVLVIFAFIMDKRNEKKMAERENNVPPYKANEIYEFINSDKKNDPANQKKLERINKFLKQEYGDDMKHEDIVLKDLHNNMKIDPLLPRIAARKKVQAQMTGKKEIIKGQKFSKKNVLAEHLNESDKNPDVGFEVLHYSVSEAQGHIEIQVIKKKTGEEYLVGIRTIEGEAKEQEDYIPIDEILKFEKSETTKTIKIKIVDDEGWEPDENFYVELYQKDGNDQKSKLPGQDTRTIVTIIDDDKPGNLSFGKRMVPALITSEFAEIEIERKDGNDGEISVEYKLEEAVEAPAEQRAIKDKDFKDVQGGVGKVIFKHQAKSMKIQVPLFPSGVQRDSVYFYVRLLNPHPVAVKVNSKDNGRCRVELVANEESLKK
jgi:solute carrier family 8 (sodium/calcium exchanger)